MLFYGDEKMAEEEVVKDLELNFSMQLVKVKKGNNEYNKLKIRIKDMKTSVEIKTKNGIQRPEDWEIEDITHEIKGLYNAYKFAGSGIFAEIPKEQLWYLIALLIWKTYY